MRILRSVAVTFGVLLVWAGGSAEAGSPGATGRVAFSLARDGDTEIYSARPDGSRRRQLTRNDAVDDYPAYSPDGRRIAFFSERDGNQEVYVMAADGSGQRRLTNNPAADGGTISWSPDGRHLAFVSQRDGNREIYVMRSDGSDQRNISRNPGEDRGPDWSPAGDLIAFHSLREGDVDATGYDLYVMQPNGSGQRDISNDASTGDGEASFSPDGTRIAYSSYTRPDGLDDTYSIRPDGTGRRNLTATETREELEPTWSPDGQSLLYQVTQDDFATFNPWLMTDDGRNQRQAFAGGAGCCATSWQPLPNDLSAELEASVHKARHVVLIAEVQNRGDADEPGVALRFKLDRGLRVIRRPPNCRATHPRTLDCQLGTVCGGMRKRIRLIARLTGRRGTATATVDGFGLDRTSGNDRRSVLIAPSRTR